MPQPPVFISYAQLDRDKHLERFVKRFREELRSVKGGPDAAALAFFDRDNVEAGDRWSETITDAVNSTQVLVCLMSPTYFNRPWCGRELEVFRRRMQLMAPSGTAIRFIFPVWWRLPIEPGPLPSRIAAFHHRDREFPDEYEQYGLRGLARRGQWMKFGRVADRLAELIFRTLTEPYQLPVGDPIADIIDIANAFDEQRPRDVRVVVAAPGGDAWQPSTADNTIGEAIQVTAENVPVFIRKVDTGVSFRAGLEQAERDQQIVLVVVDAASQPDAMVHTINQVNLSSLALLLIDADTPAAGTDNWLTQFPSGSLARAKAAGLMRIASAGKSQSQMEILVEDARRKLLMAGAMAKAEDATLEQQARAAGVDPTRLTKLSGPAAGIRP